MLKSKLNLLVLAPHTDDEVIGCGGIIHRQIERGAKHIRVVAFSHNFAGKNLINEFKDAAKILGVSDYTIHAFTPRYFDTVRQEIRDILIHERNTFSEYDAILVPQRNDPHQDHQVITEEAIRIFNRHTILGYEGPAKSRAPKFDLVVGLTKNDITAKVQAFFKFKSQRDRFYYKKEFFFGRATDRGALIEQSFAEAFEVIRMTA